MADTTYEGLRVELRNLAGQPAGSDFDNMANAAINRYYRLILAYVDQDEQTREFTITTAASTRDYGLPTYIKRILNIEDGTNNRSLTELTPKEYNTRYPGTDNSGDPRAYHILGSYGVQTQPSSATTIQVVSSESGDDSGAFVRVQGFDASDRLIDEQLTLNGTSAVTSTNSFEKIETVVKSTTSGSTIDGYVTVSDGSTTFAVIPYWDNMSSHLWVRMYPNPDSALSLTVQGVMRKPPLVRDDDWPQFDPDYHHLLVSGPASELLAAVGKSGLANKMLRDYTFGLKDFKGTQSRRPNRFLTWGTVSNANVLPDRPLIPNVDYV